MRERILEDMKMAMKAQDKKTLTVIKMVRGAMQLEEINLKRELTDDEVIGVIAKQIKMRKESIVEFEKGNREDLICQTEEEINILNKYMPEQLTEEEVNKIIDETICEIHPIGIKDMGKIMSVLNPKLKGRTDMSLVSKILRDKLNNL